ncbi:unnamed protein product [Paramecium sonneborni]|uniref:Uncharacterized protein n=1 Tax=Paramecium sonneborni TaxID=65129 RepID=A0A8S1RR40_9CILI|nr:unnamed protein product [Paramecium sonneborni]
MGYLGKKKIKQQQGHTKIILHFHFIQIKISWHLEVMIKQLVYGVQTRKHNYENQIRHWRNIFNFNFPLMVILQHQMVVIVLSAYGMLQL